MMSGTRRYKPLGVATLRYSDLQCCRCLRRCLSFQAENLDKQHDLTAKLARTIIGYLMYDSFFLASGYLNTSIYHVKPPCRTASPACLKRMLLHAVQMPVQHATQHTQCSP